jgi:ribonuclease III
VSSSKEAEWWSGAAGYTFRNRESLHEALTHRSLGVPNYERLEFLGDSVLNCVIALELYQRFPQLSEGVLSRLRATLVNKNRLSEVAEAAGVGDYVRVGEGELKSGGQRRPSILADAFEALLGAVLVDGGFDATQRVIGYLFRPLLDRVDPDVVAKDAKTVLQEWLQSRKLPVPTYTVTATRGEAHEQTFSVECLVPKLNLRCPGEGASRRAAEQRAAEAALLVVQHRG